MSFQPISTAPKDGTRILLGSLDKETVIGSWCASEQRWTHGDEQSDLPYDTVTPTHWMPLPVIPPSPSPQELHSRIDDYFLAGGLFNPEMMEHDKVQQLLSDTREFLIRYHGTITALPRRNQRPANQPSH
jgi:hypothetical protein